MYVIVAKNHDEYENWLNSHFKYVGDEKDIAKIDPTKVTRIILAEGYDQHPVYFTDAFLKLQFEVAAHKVTPRTSQRKWYRRWL